MYQQPLRPQQTWPAHQFAQAPKPNAVSTWPSAPVIPGGHAAPGAATAHVQPAPATQAFVPPVPPGVNPQQWQNGRWSYTSGPGAQPQAAHPPPTALGWNVPSGWGVAAQYYYPPQAQKQPDRSYWDTQLTDNGLGLENMHIKKPVPHPAPGESRDKPPHTPWAWVPRELDDDDDDIQEASTTRHHHPPPPQQQSNPAGHASAPAAGGWQVGTGASGGPAPANATSSYPSRGVPPPAYFAIPGEPLPQPSSSSSQPSSGDSNRRPVLPPAAVFSTHIRQQSNPQQSQQQTSSGFSSHSNTSSVTPTSSRFQSQPASTSTSLSSAGSQALQRSHTLAAPTPQRPGLPESFTSVKQLRPTFSPAIVRTPNHYRTDRSNNHDSYAVVPSPHVTAYGAAGGSGSAGTTTSANRYLDHGPESVPSPRVLPWMGSRADHNTSPTPSPRQPRPSRTEPSRIYESTRTTQPVQRSYSIPEPPRAAAAAPVSRQSSMPVVPSAPAAHAHGGRPSIANLAHFAEEPDAMLSPLIGTVPSDSSESSTSTATLTAVAPVPVAESPPPLFVPPRYARSPSPSPAPRPRPRPRRSHAASPVSSSSSSESDDDSDDARRRQRYRSRSASRNRRSTYSTRSGHSGHSTNSGNSGHSARHGAPPPPLPHTPQGRSPASTSSAHTQRSSASSSNPLPTPPQERRFAALLPPPPQLPPPRGAPGRRVRYGFWNRRGDYLVDHYVVYAPPARANPPELEGYPLPLEGYRDHHGRFVRYDAGRVELPESLPRQGQPPMLPYDKFVTYLYL
ncbi:hypothetical protein BC834DRAFT_970664 [Gloeopeniophorella convolvens]|nr:hypothetical protein BC834DRAFT_970664 [Gloeopeniophorella convolvens]